MRPTPLFDFQVRRRLSFVFFQVHVIVAWQVWSSTELHPTMERRPRKPGHVARTRLGANRKRKDPIAESTDNYRSSRAGNLSSEGPPFPPGRGGNTTPGRPSPRQLLRSGRIRARDRLS
ncbi:hypothetical protein BDY21DRAFT_344839 [Lineolata rhizophorae]|uniref:Uncharacterized protein n=1 Tax=Lineolata rhizophorae TaxID=578093 RepID=A0A6A6NZ99_9PEZI|nr:hypothetical protein BDY21DRAFT_344839 [Lineolata rhizophorae]